MLNRYRRGLETCPQANLSQSVNSATTVFTSLHHKNNSIILRTSMTQRLVENTLHTLAHFRLHRLRPEVIVCCHFGTVLDSRIPSDSVGVNTFERT